MKIAPDGSHHGALSILFGCLFCAEVLYWRFAESVLLLLLLGAEGEAELIIHTVDQTDESAQ